MDSFVAPLITTLQLQYIHSSVAQHHLRTRVSLFAGLFEENLINMGLCTSSDSELQYTEVTLVQPEISQTEQLEQPIQAPVHSCWWMA